MAELRIWMGMLSRPEPQNLEPVQLAALLSVAATVADLESLTPGLLPANAIYRVPWTDGPADLRDRISELVDAGLMERYDDPDGWIFPGWTDEVRHYRAGMTMAWGQHDIEKLLDKREHARARAAKARGGGSS